VTAYILRRCLYSIPILVGVNLLTFWLFFMVNTPDDMARLALGNKHVSPEMIQQWKHERGYDKPLLLNAGAGGAAVLTDTIFYDKSIRLFMLDFGSSDAGRDIAQDIRQRMWPSLAIAVPTLLIALLVEITMALFVAMFRGSYVDFWAQCLCIVMMSISMLFYIIGGQYLVGRVWRLVPISGFGDGADMLRFIALPVIVGVIGGLGASVRVYRTYFLEETERDFVRTARAKGLAEMSIMFRHVFGNALIPILTGLVAVLPSLFLGSLIIESFFAIPGLGSYTIEAIQGQDFAIVRAMVFLGTAMYIIGLILTDLAYSIADPRVRLQ
jgi:peptide/nickel transport system permease protein